MKKRVLAGLLWFYVTWYAWSLIAASAGLTELWGPVLGAVVAMFVAGDPLGRIWKTSGAQPTVLAPSTAAGEPA